MFRPGLALLFPLALVLPTAASADYVIADDVIIDGGGSNDQLCVGDNCTNPETYSLNAVKIKMKDESTSILFDDIDQTSWRLDANIGGLSRFRIVDQGNGTAPFDITAAAPTGSLFITSDGDIGLGTTIPGAPLHIARAGTPWIRLEDTRTTSGMWDIIGFADSFQIQDRPNSTTPFYIAADTPSWSLLVDGTGKVGVGTPNPQRNLHVMGINPGIRLEHATPLPVAIWDLSAGPEFRISTAYASPFLISENAPGASLWVDPAGYVGMGIEDPSAPLHLRRNDGAAQIMVEETSATANPRTLLNLQNNGRPEIVMGNSAKASEWSFGAGASFFLKTGALGSASGAKTKVFTVKGNGDAILAGSLTTGGTTCGGGCDRVFTEDYDLPSIAEHAARMKALGHLPNVGPTVEGAPFNLTDKLGRMLNELEHAHLYIAEQQDEIAAHRAAARAQADRIAAQAAALADTNARLSALAARLAALEHDRTD